MEKIKAFCCWSGGKESILSCYEAMQNRNIRVDCLLNMISEDGRHSRSHGISSGLIRLQAEGIGIPIVQRKTSWENYEKEFKILVRTFKRENIQAGIFGDIDLQEHRDWVERVCKEAGIKPILPLWKIEREELLGEFIALGFKAVICATHASLLGKEWLGREIDEEFLEKIKARGDIDLCGEKGEYHTFVFDGPIFKKAVKFSFGKKILNDNHWFLKLYA